jgi:hypothetical protein
MNLKRFYFLNNLSFSFLFYSVKKGDPGGVWSAWGAKKNQKSFSPGWYYEPGLKGGLRGKNPFVPVRITNRN